MESFEGSSGASDGVSVAGEFFSVGTFVWVGGLACTVVVTCTCSQPLFEVPSPFGE